MVRKLNRRNFMANGLQATGALLIPSVAGAWTGTNMRKAKQNYNPMYKVANQLGLGTNLKLCLDAGDSSSYDGTSQTWVDKTVNVNFYRGTTSGAQASDPTFNGTAGRLSSAEYFSFDGGDYFTSAVALPAWIQNMHKNNAIFTILTWVRQGTAAATQTYFGTQLNIGATAQGIGLLCDVGGVQQFLVRNGAGTALSVGGAAISANVWHLHGVSVNEGAATGLFQYDGTVNSFTSTYTSPSAANSAGALTIGGNSLPVYQMSNNSRIASVLVWEGTALTQAQMVLYYNATRTRFGV